MRPLIGLTCSLIENKRNAVNLTYLNAVRGAGALPVTLPYVENAAEALEYVRRLDGFIFTGGADIDPAEYCEEKHEKLGELCVLRDKAEKSYFQALCQYDLPTLGICRGMQSLNVFAGGTLWQDIPSQLGTDVAHSNASHVIDIAPDTLFYRVIGKAQIEVNSYHHQCVKSPAPGYKVVASSPDGVPEALVCEGRDDFLAVQYHPEMLCETDENARKIFEWFANVCKKQ